MSQSLVGRIKECGCLIMASVLSEGSIDPKFFKDAHRYSYSVMPTEQVRKEKWGCVHEQLGLALEEQP